MKEVFYAAENIELDFLKRAGCQFAAFTARSPAKSTANEDCAGWIRLDRDRWVFIVADGLGGLPAGEAASRLAVELILEQLETLVGTLDTRSALLVAIDHANRAILDSGTGGATTLAVIELDNNTIRPYHIGDSTILVTGQRGRVKFQSVSHSPTGYMEEAGLINEREAMMHEERNLVSNVVGSEEMRLEIGPQLSLNRYDTVILASDGLSDNLAQRQVVELVRKGPLDQALFNLAHQCQTVMKSDEAANPSHADDLTMIGIRRTW